MPLLRFSHPAAGQVPVLLGPCDESARSGTQKIEEELHALFPAARIVRMDSDSVKGRQAYEMLLGKVDRREVDILLGTQMIAKGHDFSGSYARGRGGCRCGAEPAGLSSRREDFSAGHPGSGQGRKGRAGRRGDHPDHEPEPLLGAAQHDA